MDTPPKMYRVVGPPGCGKTRWLSEQVKRAVEKFGSMAVMVMSFSRAAAEVVAGRDTGLPEHNVNTLHAFGRRALASRCTVKGVADSPAGLKEWNKFAPPMLSLQLDDDERGGNRTGGAAGEAFDRIKLLRSIHGLNPPGLTPYEKRLYEEWQRFKEATGLFDFQDFIELPLLAGDPCPGDPMCIFADEAQDFSRTQWNLIRSWGEQASTFVVVGDPDQVLYGWAGVDPGDFFDPDLPETQVRVLRQSWRVPQAVHEVAVRWISQMPGWREVNYDPKPDVGNVIREPIDATDATAVLDLAESIIARGKTCALLASANYMLYPWIAEAMSRGIPFHNPYRLVQNSWNPLGDGSTLSAARRLYYMLKPAETGEAWTAAELSAVVEWLDSDVLHHGAKAAIERMDTQEGGFVPLTRDVNDFVNLTQWLDLAPRATWLKLLAGDELWYLQNTLKSHAKKLEYPYKIAKRRGRDALIDTPKLVFGNIHSVKGGEADHVILSPMLSQAARDAWFGKSDSPERREIYRLFYVGITRAADVLHILEPRSYDYAVDLFE